MNTSDIKRQDQEARREAAKNSPKMRDTVVDPMARIERLIQRAADAAARRTVQELKRAGALREGQWNEYKRAEQLLRLYAAQRGITAEQAAAVEQALASISGERYAEVIQLFYLERKTNAEIADILHASERTISRARQRLMQKLAAKVAKT